MLEKNKINKFIIIILFIISLILVVFSLYNNNFKNRVSLDKILEEIDNVEVGNTTFALMIQKDDGTYDKSSSSKWPTDMKFNSELSNCLDIYGNKMTNVLSYDVTNNLVYANVTGTAYCYVYFDKNPYCEDGETLGECLLRKNSEIDSLNDNIEAGLYRYQGVNSIVKDNYVCFGTTDKTTCTGLPSTYMYRIIGIDENNQIKLMKRTSLGSNVWYSDKTVDISWPDSNLFTYLNGNGYLLNTTYVPVGWKSKIVDTSWKYGDTKSNGYYSGATIYAIENGWTDTVNAKIGLMYIHDYYYAYGVGGNPADFFETVETWMYTGDLEWTMTRSGYYSAYDFYGAWYMPSVGNIVTSLHLSDPKEVRPVFYLMSDVKYLNGNGTINNPFLIRE